MRVMPIAVGGLSLFLGMALVLVFHEPGQQRRRALERPAYEAASDAPSSERVALGKRRDPLSEVARTTKTAAPEGVDARWAQLNAQGIAALDAGEHQKAVDLFEECRVAVPGEPVFATNQAEALARLATSEFDADDEARRARAIEHMTRAVELAPARADLAKRLAQMKSLSKSEEGMWTDQTEHFQLSYDGARSDLLGGASVLTIALESAYQEFGELFGVYPVENGRPKIRVVLYRRDDFHATTGMGHWAGGLYDGTVRVPVDDLKKEKGALTRVLRHELTHAFVHFAGGTNVPGWLNEGLAQRLEFDSMAHAQTALEGTRRALHGAELLSLGAMQGALGEVGDDKKIALAYREALAFVGWLERQYGDHVPCQLVTRSREDGLARAFQVATGVTLEAAWADFASGL